MSNNALTLYMSRTAWLLALAAGVWQMDCVLLALAATLTLMVFDVKMRLVAPREEFDAALRCALMGVTLMVAGALIATMVSLKMLGILHAAPVNESSFWPLIIALLLAALARLRTPTLTHTLLWCIALLLAFAAHAGAVHIAMKLACLYAYVSALVVASFGVWLLMVQARNYARSARYDA